MWTKALTNVLFGRHDHCRLCFCEADENDISFHDEVLLNLKTEKISDMLTYILGGKYTSGMYREDIFCRSCVLSVKNTYNFIKMCKEKSNSYINIIESLNESLKETVGVEKTKSVLIHIDSKDYSFMQFYQYREESVKLPAGRKLGNPNSKFEKGKIKKPKKLKPTKHDKRQQISDAVSSQPAKATQYDHTTQENDNENLIHIPETQDKINLEEQHSNLKAVIKKVVSKKSRRHVLKSNTIKSKATSIEPGVLTSENHQRDLENPPNSSLCTEISSKTYSVKRVNIIRRNQKFRDFAHNYICDHCGQHFRHQYQLRRHTEMQTCKLVCKICNITFPDLFDLRDHNRKEHKEQAYRECDVCHVKYCIETFPSHRNSHFNPKSSFFIPRND